MTIEQVKDIILNSDEISKDSPEPLRRTLEQSTEFPLDALPPILKDAVLAINDIVQAPIPLCVQSVLSVVNLAVQGHINIKLPTGEEKPISGFFLTIAESGERKTTCDNIASAEVDLYEQDLRAEYNINLLKYNNKQEAWKSEHKKIHQDYKKSKNKFKLEADLNELGSPPKPPLTPLLICTEPTFEGLCKLMTESRASLGIFSSEGGQFISGHAMKSENKRNTAGGLSRFWDKGIIVRTRSIDGNTIIAGKRLSMHLMVQPNIGTDFLSDLDLKDQGLFSRLLISKPQSTIGTRFQREAKPESNKWLSKFNLHLRSILRLELPLKSGCDNELKPRIVEMDEQAIKAYKEFADHIEKQIGLGQPLESIRGFASKLPEHACRIAATLAAFDNINFVKLEYKYIKMGIEIGSYYCAEAFRLLNNGKINPDIILAEKLLDWMYYKWDGGEYISPPNIYTSLSIISTKKDALRIINILVEHGYLTREKDPRSIKGQIRKEVFKINKSK